MSSNIAIWVLVVIAGAVAVFLIRLLHQLTRVASESETTLRSLNKQLPKLINDAERVLTKADMAVDRVNLAMDEMEGPIQLFKGLTHLFSISKRFLSRRLGRGLMAFSAGFKASKVIAKSLKQHFTGQRKDSP